jgi:BirA family biotin operon repressor/biotin-[acetyl-CoA-carboxylase] ligase
MPNQQPKHSSHNMTPAALLSLLNDYHLLSFDTIDSTNEEAKRLAANGGSHGAVIWAKEQTHGKGRAGREWQSISGNLFVTVLLQPGCDIAIIPQMTYVAALAVLHTIQDIVPQDAEIALKWPNDVLINGKKVAGILLESFQVPNDDQRWVAVGVGINVEGSPSGVTFPATSLKEEGVEIISAKIVLSRYVHCFVEAYNKWSKSGFASVRRQWNAAAWSVGKQVKISLPHEEIQGVFKNIDADGGLVIQISATKKRTIHAGDMVAL